MNQSQRVILRTLERPKNLKGEILRRFAAQDDVCSTAAQDDVRSAAVQDGGDHA